MPYYLAEPTDTAIDMHIIQSDALDGWLGSQDADVAGWVAQNGFTGKLGETLFVPSTGSRPVMVLAGYGSASKRARVHFPLASAATKLPEGIYQIASGIPDDMAETECLGWLMSGYKFDRYKSKSDKSVGLIPPETVDAKKVSVLAEAETLIRNLVNTPASDMGPADLAAASQSLADTHGASFDTIIGEDLLEQNFPLIHTVGRAAATPPRLIDMRWGKAGPKLTLVGKGVCFDTGGLNLKPSGSMSLMKKDMGGAAHVLGIAKMIMALDLPLQLRVLIPAVENSVSGNSFRPGDIMPSRKGLTVENNNTDAEGRLVLADALALASEEKPDLILSMATLTGAAGLRLALILRRSLPITTTLPPPCLLRRAGLMIRSGACLFTKPMRARSNRPMPISTTRPRAVSAARSRRPCSCAALYLARDTHILISIHGNQSTRLPALVAVSAQARVPYLTPCLTC